MRVRRKIPAAAPSEAVADFLADDPAARPSGSGGTRARSLSDLAAAVLDAESRAKTGDWSGTMPRVIVGLYAWCHRSVYGVLPVELETVGEFRIATRAATRLVHVRFEDDVARAADFVRWSWIREKERAAWASRANKDRNRMGWRLQFSDRQVTDYLVARSSRRGG